MLTRIMSSLKNLFGLIENQQSEPQSASDSNEPVERSAPTFEDDGIGDRAWLEYQGQRFYCQLTESPDGQYQVAYADGQSGQEEPTHGIVFLFANGNHQFTTRIERPNGVAVSNSGTVAIVDWEFGWGDGDLSGTFHVYDREGTLLLAEQLDSNLGPCAITPDGSYAATTTLNPDCSTYVFDVPAGSRLTRHENEGGNKQHLSFEETDGEWYLYIAESDRDEPSYAINLAGNVVWRNEKDNLRGDVGELIERLEQGDTPHEIERDLNTIAQQTPAELAPHLPSLLDLIESGAFQTVEKPDNQLDVPVASVFTSIAKAAPEECESHLNRLVANVRDATTPAAAVASTRVFEQLVNEDLTALEYHYDDFLELLEHDSFEIRRRAVNIVEHGAGKVYDQNTAVAGQLAERLRSEEDLGILRDIVTALTSLVDARPEAIERIESAVPRSIELLTIGDPDYQYGDVSTYDYKDQTHYDTNHLHRTVPSLMVELAPRYGDDLVDAIPTLLTMLQQPGQRNTSLRSASHKALSAIAEHSTDAEGALDTEFDRIVGLLDHDDVEVREASVELLAFIGTEESKKQLITVQDQSDEEIGPIVSRALTLAETSVTLDPEVRQITPSGSDAIERQQNRISVQRAYEFLQAEESARKQDFLDSVYTEEDRQDNEDKWWRMIRASLKSIATVELSGNTYRYTSG